MNTKPTSVEAYLTAVPGAARATLEEIRRMVRSVAPDAVESISYGMPTFKYDGKYLIYYAAAKTHCALYGTSGGTIRFPPDRPPAEDYVRELVEKRMADIDTAAAGRKRGKGAAAAPA